jgi:DNA-binding NarL/FixJ family response regulator
MDDTGKTRILIVDGHPIVRQGISQGINREADLVVCGQAKEARAAVDAIRTLRPGFLIIDISLTGPDDLDLLKTIRSRDTAVRVLILSMHDETLYAERALRAGAKGYFIKQEATDNVLVAIRRIIDGEIYVSDRMAKRVRMQFAGNTTSPKRSPIECLPDRDLEIFHFIGEGHALAR